MYGGGSFFGDRKMRRIRGYVSWLCLAFLAVASGSSVLMADVTVLGVQYRADRMFPEYLPYWQDEGISVPPELYEVVGCSVHVFVRNTGAAPVTISDVELAGESLTACIAFDDQRVDRKPASIYFANLTEPQMQTLLAAGEPVWWKTDPAVIEPGGAGQVMIRLRNIPQTPTVAVNVVHSGGTTSATVPVQSDQSRLVGVNFSADLGTVYLYSRHWQAGMAPVAIVLDGQDVTANASIACDPSLQLAPTVLQLSQNLVRGSYHVFQVVYSDGQVASAGLRAWNDEFAYGMWGAAPGSDGDYELARDYIEDVSDHLINIQMVTLGSQAVKSYLKTAEGRAFAASHDLRFVVDAPGKWGVTDPFLFFIHDEPDAGDYRITGLPADKMIGSLAQWCVGHAEEQRATDPRQLAMLNLDMTYKPQNWYIYGQVPDVMAVDPYYQARLKTALWSNPEMLPYYTKATYVYAVSQTAETTCQPNPLHVILYGCSYVDSTTGQTFPFAPPACKRIEAYYALAGGAKGLSYWWYIQVPPFRGIGAAYWQGDADAMALWDEMGLIGAEARTVGPVLKKSCPAEIPVQPSAGLWVRSLVAGMDTLVLLAVNDEYANSEQGIAYTPLADASMTVDLPSWMSSPTAFEVNALGIRDVQTQLVGDQLEIDLGWFDVTRMIVVTDNWQLRGQLQQRYDEQFEAKVLNIVGDVGACCLPAGDGTGTCAIMTSEECLNHPNGSYLGDGTTCGVNNEACGFDPPVPGDMDLDGDVDMDDFGRFQACLSGAEVEQANPACARAKLDAGADVDGDDLAIFVGCMSGAGVPGDVDCAD